MLTCRVIVGWAGKKLIKYIFRNVFLFWFENQMSHFDQCPKIKQQPIAGTIAAISSTTKCNKSTCIADWL